MAILSNFTDNAIKALFYIVSALGGRLHIAAAKLLRQLLGPYIIIMLVGNHGGKGTTSQGATY